MAKQVSASGSPGAFREHARPSGSVRIGGDWGDSLRRTCRNWTLRVNGDVLLQGFRKRPGPRPFSGEHVGKWLLGAMDMNLCLQDEELSARIRHVVEELVSHQEPDGYLGTYVPEDRWQGGIPHPTPFYFWPSPKPSPHGWDLWVHKYCILALLRYHELACWEPALAAAKRAADLVAREFGPDSPRNLNRTDEHLGLASGSILEPFVLLYRRTGEARYLEFARRIVTYFWEQPDAEGPRLLPILRMRGDVNRIGRGKAYEMMSCFVGLVEYARATDDGDLLQMVIDARDRIADSMRYPTGGMSNSEWFVAPGEFPERANIETCVAFTWMQLNLRLFEAANDDRGLELAEWTAWNQLLPALCPDGSTWTYHLPVTGPKRFARHGGQEGDEGGALTCCHTNGQRGLALLPQYYYAVDSSGALCVNLYGESSTTVTLPGVGEVVVEQHSRSPRDAQVEIRLHPSVPGSYVVCIRRPAWADGLTVDDVSVGDSGGRHEIRCNGDTVIRVRFDVSPRLLMLGFEARGRYAASYGPLVMALDHPPVGWSLDAVALDVHPETFSGEAAVTEEQGWPVLETPVVRLPGLAIADASAMAAPTRARARLKPVLLCGLEGNPCLTRDLGFAEIAVHDPESRKLLPEYRVMLPCYPARAPRDGREGVGRPV